MPTGLAGAIGQVVSTGLGAFSTGTQNRKARKWSERMYDRERADSIAFWNMQNAYNSPQAQMQRYKDAGLNPNLIYGQGNSGNAGSIPTPNTPRPEFKVPDFSGIGGVLPAFMDMELKAETRDNLIVDRTVKLEEAALKAAQRANIQQNTKRSVFDLDLETELRDISAQARKENLRQLQIGNAVALNRDEREALSNVASIRESIERVLNLREQRANTVQERRRIRAATADVWKSAQLKQLDIELRKNGIMPSDPLWARITGRAVNSALDSEGSGGSWLSRIFNYFK